MGKNYFLPLDLERVLAQRLNVWLADFRLLSPEDNGAVPVPVQIVRGYVPSFQAGPQAEPQNKAPVVAVRCVGGWHDRQEGATEVHFFILTWKKDLDRTGVLDVKNIVEKIILELYQESVIDNSYPLLDEKLLWSVIEDPDKDHFPYFLGGVIAHFGVFTPSPPTDYTQGLGTDEMVFEGSTTPIPS
jgi:hypothetical protein